MLKSLLEDTQNNYALQVKDCIFNYITAKNNGGGICIMISNGEPLKPIEINHCEFTFVIATEPDTEYFGTKEEKGGSIYYDFNVPSSTSSKSLLEDATGTNIYSFRTYNCKFTYGSADYYGGAIYLHVANREPSNLIEIDTCTFENNKAHQAQDISSGGSIYYYFGTLTTTTKSSSKVMFDTNPGLRINNCEFSSSNSDIYGGAVYLSVMDSNPTKTIEMSHCKINTDCYSKTNQDSLYIKSNTKFKDLFYITECNFNTRGVLCDCFSAKFEKCEFKDISTYGKNAIRYSSTIDSSLSDNNYLFTIDHCNFSQSSDIDSLVFFVTPLPSKFSFTNNRIEMSERTNTRVFFGCEANIQIKDETYWYFFENYIDPAERKIIKTENAQNIPADCGMKGFLCDLPQSPTEEAETSSPTKEAETSTTSEDSSTSSSEISSSSTEEMSSTFESSSEELPVENCVGNNRCEIEEDDGESSITLKDRNYDSLNNTDYGAAIRLINHCLICQNSVFYRCKVNIGGGGIYISIKKKMESSEILLEGLKFIECQAIYGGAVYIYNEQEFPVKIILCTFYHNIAAKKPQSGLDKNLYGGSAVYLQVKDASVTNCTFYKNKGSGLKIYNILDEQSPSSSISLKQVDSLSVSINDCFFEIDKNSTSSIFYVHKNEMNEIPVEVKDCVFAGDFSKDAHHIDGSLLNEIKEKSKFRIKSCKFSSGIENAVNLKKYPLLFDLSDNKLNVEIDIKKNKLASNLQRRNNGMNLSITIIAITVASVIAVIVVISVFAIKKRNQLSEDSLENGDIFELNMNEL